MLALRLVRAGVRVRVVDAAAEPGTTSRALVVHARTLEFYRQMGLADAFLEQGLRFTAANLWVRGRRVAHVALGEMGRGLSPFPFMTVCAQEVHERFLVGELERHGVQVERGTELVGFEQGPDRVQARLRTTDGTERRCEASYLAGCDGAHSTVRDLLATGFPGGTYSRFFYVADVEASGPMMNDELHVALDEADFLAIFPLKGAHTGRLVGTIQEEGESEREKLRFEDVGGQVAERMRIDVRHVNWFSTYRVHHRVASHFRHGRVFLLGDAAHIHSPVGGQGLNTGLGDAVNLAWKLADVLEGRAAETLLDSYEPERIAFARRLIATTDRAFTIATSSGPFARFVRLRVVPRILPRLVRIERVRRFMFRVLSQIAISYRASGWSRQGKLERGDRLPWVELDSASGPPDNFATLDGRTWQVHVYGEPGPGLADACQRLDLSLHVFAWRPAMRAVGLVRDALVLVRPDGHVWLVGSAQDAGALVREVETIRGARAA